MLKNYLKTAWRNLMKNKTFSFINVMGLAIGIASFLLIVNYLRFEYSYDDYNIKKDRIYRVPMITQETGGKPQSFAFTYPAVAPAMKKDFPEVEEAIRFRKRWGIVRHGDQKITEDGLIWYVDPAVFNVFSFTFKQGSSATAFIHLNDAVITLSTAKKYFGTENPLGQRLNFQKEDFVVTAVLDDIPANSHIQFDILLNYNKYIQQTNNAANNSWGWSDFYTYLLLRPGTDAKSLQAKMPAFAERYMGADMKEKGYTNSFIIEPLKDIHTKSEYDYEIGNNGNLSYLKYLAVAALLILLIALINYINLSTARSLERSKEVGVRKVIGATRFQLQWQFLSETFITNILGILAGFVLFRLSLPEFSLLIGRQVIDLEAADFKFWAFIAIIFFLCTLLAGFYPSFLLSSFRPVVTLKSAAGFAGVMKDRNFLRKSLVIIQFTAAIVLIGGSIGFYRQLQFMSHRDLGININQTLVLQQTGGLDSSDFKRVAAFVNDLSNIAGVKTVTTSTSVPGGEVGGSSSFRLLSSNAEKRCRDFGIDEKFIPDFKLSLAAGRNFDKDKPQESDTNQVLNVILNATASNVLGFHQPKDAINQLIVGSGHTCKIVGVLNDFHQESLQNNFDPIVFYPEQPIYMSFYSMKLNTSNLQVVLDRATGVWTSYFPSNPLSFFFLDQHFNEQYKKDRLFSTILWLFTILAIIVASLGLFGLSLFTVTKRTKEISVRKVLGASVLQITTLITKDFLKLILLAGVIAIPVAYFLLQNWLKDYAFHISIGFWFFLLPILLIVVIALLTVLYQSLKAALSNPVESLRAE